MKTNKINLQAELSQPTLDEFFNKFQPVIGQLNQIIEAKNRKKNAISISKVGSGIRMFYKKTDKSNSFFLNVEIKEEYEFDTRLEFAIQSVFNACRDNDCYDLVRVYGAKERGHTMGFKFSIDNKDYDCILWERPEVIYMVMRHAEPKDHGFDLTSKGYEQAKSVANKLKNLFPDENEWSKNCAVSLPNSVLRITCTASTVGSVLDETIDKFNIQRLDWLGLKALESESSIPYGARTMIQNTDHKYQLIFTHWDVAEKAFPTFVKELKLEEGLINHHLEHAECVVMYPSGEVVHLLP